MSDGGGGERDRSGGGDPAADDRPALAEQRDVPDVYGPAEDSALLADAVRETVRAGERALDLGTGSGYVADALADAGADVVASDLNPEACGRARVGGHAVVRGDLLGPFREGAFDCVAFNPPYLPTPAEREWDDWMERALSGGEDGRRLVDPFLDDVGRVLAANGRALLLVSSLTGIEAVREYGREQGLASEDVASESHPFERLVVLRFERI